MALLADALHRFLSDRTVQKACLTEAAAAYAAAEDLFDSPVMDDLDIRHDEVIGIVALVHIHHHALFYHGRSTVQRSDRRKSAVVVVAYVIQRGHVHALYPGSKAQKIFPALSLSFALPVQLDDLQIDLLPVAEEKNIYEVRDRLGIARAGAARNHDMLQPVPVL